MAATLAFEPFVHNAQMNIQVHGGIGFTWEHDAHLYPPPGARAQRGCWARRGRRGRHHHWPAGAYSREVTLDLPPEAEQLRAELRVEVATTGHARAGTSNARRFIDTGLMVPHWPRPWGRDAGAVEQLVIDEELKAAGVRVPPASASPGGTS